MAITDKDVEKFKFVFATKEELNSFRGEMKGFRGEALTRLDRIIGEQEKTKEDKVLAKEKDDKQDQRLDRLEAKVGIA
jgi:hypothetical protein